ncbi:YitT family protein [Paraburkholderia sp. JPY432]|uniref:YitT family protein n=1 Tax=Paraburkholderia youngii TaxID=2782701 RepID=UPI0015957F31|nr:YitT family protein [Paraburkholderia youngii]NVH76109.1 YitT family protein [Paraburkholderia youngii]
MSQPAIRHRPYEDVVALLVGSLLVSLGINLYNRAGLMTGGTAGLAFLIHYLCGWTFGPVYFAVNAPFQYFAFRRMSRQFRFKTFCAVTLVAGFSMLHPRFIHYDRLDVFYAAVLGASVMATGFVVLFRHRASLGGVNIAALFLQEKHGIRAGKVQMAVDMSIVAASLFVVSTRVLAASLIGALVLNLVVALNHRPGRYVGV